MAFLRKKENNMGSPMPPNQYPNQHPNQHPDFGGQASSPPPMFDLPPMTGQELYEDEAPPQNAYQTPPGQFLLDEGQGGQAQPARGMDQGRGDGFLPGDGLYPAQEEPEPDRGRRSLSLLITAAVVILVLLLLRFQVFVVRKVNISGTSAELWQSVARETGLDHGMFYFSVNEDRVREGVESNRYLIFDSMEKIIPGTVNLKVIQRRPFAFFTHLGVGYVLAKDGMILEQTRELKDGQNLMQVIGLAVWGQQSPGSLPASTDPAQSETLLEVFEELSTWGFDGQVYTLDIAESLNLTLQTIDGYTINLGSSENLHAKIGTVASVVNELRRRGMTGGIIEATRPGEATYRAEQ